MNVEAMEARIKALENQVKILENQVNALKDVEEIKKLQRAYGFYLEHWMSREVIDCFADGPGVGLHFPEGSYLGKERVREYFSNVKEEDPEILHQLMQLSPFITLAPDGKTANGRWYCFGALALTRGGGVEPLWGSGTYENEYVKENGKWKIRSLKWIPNYLIHPGEGWVKPERAAAVDYNVEFNYLEPDLPPEGIETKYPAGYIFPFHYKHPVTGKGSTEGVRNASLKRRKSE
jgi:hypothetical protein